ncbi:microtubule-associated proteins 1A/1B light chain 3C-like [Protobothrops mucrosquamatus]|uniref:microtubule-associated proteins 1A/1B light chain 3C-like n=1 Tax=Protobothrops mucrosquamatus TaxID=103944 RepID=UPI0010FACFDB|nr:microtubule-associated proteins 1A/1B light chain 3C-like [Protobothrops mucrosquamatus]
MASFPPFKHRKPFECPSAIHRNSFQFLKKKIILASRKNEVAAIRIRFPYKLPVILERYAKEKILPALHKVKFLVPQEFTMGQLVAIIRNRMGLRCTQAFYFLLDSNHSLVNMSATMGEVYTTYKDEDGFLYMTYASQEMFG